MKYVVGDDSGTIGPFDTFEKAQLWCEYVGIDPKRHIRFLIEPEPNWER